MSEIKPRWEWRSFGERFGDAEQRLAALTPGGVQESDEIYLLSGAGANVKIRAELVDIKVLSQYIQRLTSLPNRSISSHLHLIF